jgi:hypothetical protein
VDNTPPPGAYTIFNLLLDYVRLAIMGACGYLGWYLGTLMNTLAGVLLFILFSFVGLWIFAELLTRLVADRPRDAPPPSEEAR